MGRLMNTEMYAQMTTVLLEDTLHGGDAPGFVASWRWDVLACQALGYLPVGLAGEKIRIDAAHDYGLFFHDFW